MPAPTSLHAMHLQIVLSILCCCFVGCLCISENKEWRMGIGFFFFPPLWVSVVFLLLELSSDHQPTCNSSPAAHVPAQRDNKMSLQASENNWLHWKIRLLNCKQSLMYLSVDFDQFSLSIVLVEHRPSLSKYAWPCSQHCENRLLQWWLLSSHFEQIQKIYV